MNFFNRELSKEETKIVLTTLVISLVTFAFALGWTAREWVK